REAGREGHQARPGSRRSRGCRAGRDQGLRAPPGQAEEVLEPTDERVRCGALMAKRIMSEEEQRRRQKLQSKIGRTTSTLGLAGVGLASAGAIAGHKPGMLKAIPKFKAHSPEQLKATGQKLKDAAFYTGIASGGIGGGGGFNQASIYSAESRRRNQTPVKKDYGMDMGYFGEEGTPLLPTEIEAEITKAWSPSASNFDS